MSSYQVIFITAKDCGHCRTLKSRGVSDKIVQSTGAKVIELESRSQPYRGPTKLDKFIGTKLLSWFPFFAVIDKGDLSLYEQGKMSDNELASQVGVFNGYYNSSTGKFENAATYKYLTLDTIKQWLSDWSKSHKPTKPRPTVVLSQDLPQINSGGSKTTYTGLANESPEVVCSTLNFKIGPRYSGSYT